MRWLIAFIALAAMSGLATAQTFVRYQCEDGSQLGTMLDGRVLHIQLDGHAIKLARRPALHGSERYGNGGVSVSVKGDVATLKRPKMKRTQCRPAAQ